MSKAAVSKSKRHPVVRNIVARPRLLICIAIGAAMLLIQPQAWDLLTRLLIAWNVGVWLYIAAASWMMAGADEHHIRRQALEGDESRFLVLTIGSLAAAASLAAIVAQLSTLKDMQGLAKAMHLGLVAATILSAWIFMHLTFALHYAHEFYIERDEERELAPEMRGGLLIPGCLKPDFSDFLYFSFVIGVACATADIDITSRPMRRVALVHCVLAFFFNTTILALTINICAGLI
jgi:uncharacterized membrane protein